MLKYYIADLECHDIEAKISKIRELKHNFRKLK